mmetsp:Transcript_21827/g.39168  ORF Transcript_21827/g.39168 Transcript_21827/m.39168 type:complete len:119 (+) Transcript_21827:378-734(+)
MGRSKSGITASGKMRRLVDAKTKASAVKSVWSDRKMPEGSAASMAQPATMRPRQLEYETILTYEGMLSSETPSEPPMRDKLAMKRPEPTDCSKANVIKRSHRSALVTISVNASLGTGA